MKTKPYITWLPVMLDSSGIKFIAPKAGYLVVGGEDINGNVVLNAPNVLLNAGDSRYLDLLSAESDYFTRLQCFMTCDLAPTNLRTGRVSVKATLRAVQVIEYEDNIIELSENNH